jgi:hypothetical protein
MFGWQARPCKNLSWLYRWFGVVHHGGFPFSFVVIFGARCWWCFENDFLEFLVGVTYEVLVPLWLVTLPPNIL